MDDLVRWLGEQLDTDAARVTAAAEEDGPDWRYDGHAVVTRREGDLVAVGSQDFMEPERGEHIAEWDPARVLREIEIDRELLAEYERLLRAHAAHKAEAARMAEAGDSDPLRIAALRREADYLPAMLHVMERWAKRKADIYSDREGYAEAIASLG